MWWRWYESIKWSRWQGGVLSSLLEANDDDLDWGWDYKYASFDLFLSVRIEQVINLSALTEVFQCHLQSIMNVATEDTTMEVSNIHGEKKPIPILKGTDVFINIIATHYNHMYLVFSWCLFHILVIKCSPNQITFPACYWDDPHKFNPLRFLKDWPLDAFLLFSAGEGWFSPFPKFAFFFIIKIIQDPKHALDKSKIGSIRNQHPYVSKKWHSMATSIASTMTILVHFWHGRMV